MKAAIIILVIVFGLYYIWGRFILKDPSGNTVGDILRRLTVKGRTCYFNPFNLSIGRVQCDYKIRYYMIFGNGYYKDTDFDGCSFSGSFNFTIKSDKDGVMVMIKTPRY